MNFVDDPVSFHSQVQPEFEGTKDLACRDIILQKINILKVASERWFR